jgi:hypothetical protein
MADDALITKALDTIAVHEAAANKLKRWVNDADIMLGNEPRFADLSETAIRTGGVPNNTGTTTKKYGPGEFFNKAFASAVKTILTDRYEAAGGSPNPASVDMIHEHLLQGSFNFETNGADQQKNSIKISLGKNSVTFVKLPGSDLFGLVEWYGGKRVKPGRRSSPITVAGSGSFANGTFVAAAENDEHDVDVVAEMDRELDDLPKAEANTATEGFRRRI